MFLQFTSVIGGIEAALALQPGDETEEGGVLALVQPGDLGERGNACAEGGAEGKGVGQFQAQVGGKQQGVASTQRHLLA